MSKYYKVEDVEKLLASFRDSYMLGSKWVQAFVVEAVIEELSKVNAIDIKEAKG